MVSELNECDAPVVNVVGEKVALGPMLRELSATYQRWFHDFDVLTTYATDGLRPLTRAVEGERYELPSRHDHLSFTVYEKEAWRPIGLTNLYDVDRFNRTAQFGIVIGEKEFWGKGHGVEATRLVLDYGFAGLGLNSILLAVFGFNEQAIGAYIQAGFRAVGRWREAHRFAGHSYDVIFMDCLAADFRAAKG